MADILRKALVLIFLGWNLYVFAVFGYDKRQARKGGWRISEMSLLLMALFMGGIGAFLGMEAFRHKTLKKKFSITLPVLALADMFIIGLAAYYGII